jgi:glucokinase
MSDSSVPRATKIVATLGPASSTPEVLERMIRAGVDVMRLNFSHGTSQDHIDRATMIREVAGRVGKEVAVMADLQGPKIRVGKIEGGKTMLEAGAKLVLDAAWTELGTSERVGLDYKELPRDVRPGDSLLLNDGLLRLTVDSVRGEEVRTTVVVGGMLSNNKGINKAGGGLTAPALTAKDMEDIKTAMSFQCEYLAVSFPKSATDMEMARQLGNVAGEQWRHKPLLIAKIERSEAIPALESILRASDGIMVARGDLAVEVGNAAVPALQKRMIKMARELDRVVITATQMMESMIVNPVPTRAEVSDVANAVLDGTDAVMLSAETAAGPLPGRDGRDDGVDLRRGRKRRGDLARRRLHQQDLRPHRPVDRDGGAVHRLSPRLQGDPRPDRVGVDRALDEPAEDPRADLRPDVADQEPASDGDVPQRDADADAQLRRPRRGAQARRAAARRRRRAQAGRHLRHHLRRADGLPRRDQHAEGRSRRLKPTVDGREPTARIRPWRPRPSRASSATSAAPTPGSASSAREAKASRRFASSPATTTAASRAPSTATCARPGRAAGGVRHRDRDGRDRRPGVDDQSGLVVFDRVLATALGVGRLLVLNDFTALALALPALSREELEPVGAGKAMAGEAVALLGPGTGLGVGCLLAAGDGVLPLASEGGHVTLSAGGEREERVIAALRREFGHPSAERALSGSGLVNLYRFACAEANRPPLPLLPADVSARALAGSDDACTEAVELFFALLGGVAGNLALTVGARGGVYIAGGIVARPDARAVPMDPASRAGTVSAPGRRRRRHAREVRCRRRARRRRQPDPRARLRRPREPRSSRRELSARGRARAARVVCDRDRDPGDRRLGVDDQSRLVFLDPVVALRLGVDRLLVLNDFTALALALPALARDELEPVGAGEAIAGEARALLGPGTGLGVGCLLVAGGGSLALASEGGHAT